ncbi:hypothetical protein DAD186_05070 [Dermabacter vaginalis]|uniref:Uncharacterized protein n=1 Tax=Dermabacter vaginalis TaxID=1630135 RepID=A0A1B0ZGN1_9MICO|nr:hypothetical protein DAD186_05070 [Dermabacter vaginalis]
MSLAMGLVLPVKRHPQVSGACAPSVCVKGCAERVHDASG